MSHVIPIRPAPRSNLFSIVSEENKGGEVKQSEPEGGVDKQWTTE